MMLEFVFGNPSRYTTIRVASRELQVVASNHHSSIRRRGIDEKERLGAYRPPWERRRNRTPASASR
jgi:hypothetical protein